MAWTQYERLVLSKLDVHDAKLDKVDNEIVDLRIDVSNLKGRARAWGTIAGIVGGSISGFLVGTLQRFLF